MIDPLADRVAKDAAEQRALSRLPAGNLQVDFGQPAPGSSEPMPDERRRRYEARIRDSVEAQAAGAEQALHLFIR